MTYLLQTRRSLTVHASGRVSAQCGLTTRRPIIAVCRSANRPARSTTILPRRSETLGSGSKPNRKDLLLTLHGLITLDDNDNDNDDDDLTCIKYAYITWLCPMYDEL